MQRGSTTIARVNWRTVRRRILWIGASVLALYVVFLTGMFIVMCQPPDRFGRIMTYVPMPAMLIVPFEAMWNVARGGSVRVGDLAPEFTLATVDRKSQVQLSAFRGKQPVVLVFGSYT
jgi:hypothetical protein